MILAQHLVLTGYGHWLPNDPRGSGSTEVRQPVLEDLGAIHHGRKRIQPARPELKSFYRKAEPLLAHPTLWFDAAMRQAIAEAIAQSVTTHGYTLWALAVLRNHAHVLVRAHRDHADVVWRNFTTASRAALLRLPRVPPDHPIWSERAYAVLLHTPEEIADRIRYINDNPPKENLPRQNWSFLDPIDARISLRNPNHKNI